MTELELYKFINDNCIEYHWEYNNSKEDVLLFPQFCQLSELCTLLGANFLDEDGYNVVLRGNYVAIWMNDICDYFDINIENIFPKNKEKK